MDYSASHLNDDELRASVPSDDRIIAFVCAHMGLTDEAFSVIHELQSYDRLAVGRYFALLKGEKLNLSEEERTDALVQGSLFEKLYQSVELKHFFSDQNV